MNSRHIFTIYLAKNKFINIYILEGYSIQSILYCFVSIAKYSYFNKKPNKYPFSIYVFLNSKYKFIKSLQLNILTCLIFSNKKYLLLWIKDPIFYYIHNFIKSKFILFDYVNTVLTNNSNVLYKNIFLQNKAFIYYINDISEYNDTMILPKDSEQKFIGQIWKFIDNKINKIKLK